MSTPEDGNNYEHLEAPVARPEPGAPPEHGAQWDEVHGRWEKWDDVLLAWVVIGDAGDGVEPAAEETLPPLLASELVHAEELEAADEVIDDVDRRPEPAQHVPGAQWNEVLGRWERWDDGVGEWVGVE